MNEPSFEWDEGKNVVNVRKHGVSFSAAQHAFKDPCRVIAKDLAHGRKEPRYYRFGRDRDGVAILTVRFTWRLGCIRIIGAGYWRKGKAIYEQANSLSR